ncbi:MAG TPA: 2-phospho-L-lactate guanylyltransferase [Solirubrobacteraceae bacterium]|nr:2-phospho-L-lactate guanylyltransferase [Solirubrobacteraceae bacterium]
MRTAAVLPVKSFGRAKQRLDAAVGQPDRGELAAAMLGDVLDALRAVGGLADVIVVTAEPRAADAARAAAAQIVDDPVEAGQSDAAARGVRAALARGAQRALLVPGDCPALDPAEVGRLLDGFPGAGLVIVPDRHGSGTNALLIAPPNAVDPSFGPGSFARHAALGAAAGLVVRVAPVPSLELDVDTPGDLAALRRTLSSLPDAAPRTRALLETMTPLPAVG